MVMVTVMITRIQKMRESSLGAIDSRIVAVHGARLLNCIPRSIQNISGCSIEMFKSFLDRFLKLVLDEPLIPGYTVMRRADSNSLLHLKVIIKNILFEVKYPTNKPSIIC